MKTINYIGYTLDVYPDGRVYKHPRVVNTITGKIYNYKGSYMKQGKHPGGYRTYKFWINGKHVHEYVHRLVGKLYLKNDNNLPEINHIDGDKTNNHFSNLEWCDRTHNVIDYVSKGRGVYGWRKIKKLDAIGKFLKEYNSIEEAAKELGCTAENISSALRNKTNTAYGFKWKYSEPPKRKGHYIGNVYL